MKQILFATVSFLVFNTVNAQPPAGDAKPGDWYGSKVPSDNAINIEEIPGKLATTPMLTTKVKAKVIDVCSKKGCWVKLAVNDSTTAFVQMKDYGFFVPTAAKGKTVVIDGKVEVVTTSVEDLQHYAKDAKKSQAEIDAITQPKKEIRLTASGITVLE